MKKICIFIIVILLCCILFGCSSNVDEETNTKTQSECFILDYYGQYMVKLLFKEEYYNLCMNGYRIGYDISFVYRFDEFNTQTAVLYGNTLSTLSGSNTLPYFEPNSYVYFFTSNYVEDAKQITVTVAYKQKSDNATVVLSEYILDLPNKK